MKTATLHKAETHSQEWHDIRRTGLGGSDCAAALGLSKWKTPYQLWLEKVGQVEPQEETWEMLRGKAMEPALRQYYSDETGRAVRLPDGILRSAEHPFMLYSPDGFTDDNRLVELKTATYSKEWGEIGSDEIPQEYLLQVQHGMIVTGLPVADAYPSIGGGKPKLFEVKADQELQNMMVERLEEFWSHVLANEAPEPINTDDLELMYKVMHPRPITATAEIIDAVIALRDARADLKQAEEVKTEWEFKIKLFMADHETLLDAHGVPLISWKQGKGAVRLDGKALKEDKPLIWDEYSVQGDPVRRFLVK